MMSNKFSVYFQSNISNIESDVSVNNSKLLPNQSSNNKIINQTNLSTLSTSLINLDQNNFNQKNKNYNNNNNNISTSSNNSNKFHYVKNFNQSSLAQYLKQSVINSNITKNNSVTKWLQDLRMMSENECLCVLQAKSLANKLNQLKSIAQTKDLVVSNSDTDLNSSRKSLFKNFPELSVYEFMEIILEKKELINEEFTKLFRKIEKKTWQNISNILKKLINNMQLTIDLLNNMNLLPKSNTVLIHNLNDSFHNQLKETENKVCTSLNILRKFIQNMTEANAHNIDVKFLLEIIKNLDDLFETYYQNIIKLCVNYQLNKINKKEPIDSIKLVLNQTLDICLKNEFVKKVIISENGILVLMSTLKDSHYKSTLDLILRTLSILCSHLDSFKSLQKIDCFGILTDILCDEKAQEWTRTECAGCIAQITSPYLDFCENLTGFLDNMEDLTRALTILCRDSSDIEIFLIGTAALANITFLDKMACEYLNQFSTAQVLIENYYLKQYNSIFVKDQITTILANMALLENSRSDIAEYNGLNLLVDFLNERPLNYINNSQSFDNNQLNDTVESELNACERVQQKAAIAISRFCKEPKYTSQLIDLGVVSRISYLCRNASERNNSDSVLVACLAALRQIAISSESLESYNLLLEADIQQLIKPKSGDSFLQCSSTEESYV